MLGNLFTILLDVVVIVRLRKSANCAAILSDYCAIIARQKRISPIQILHGAVELLSRSGDCAVQLPRRVVSVKALNIRYGKIEWESNVSLVQTIYSFYYYKVDFVRTFHASCSRRSFTSSMYTAYSNCSSFSCLSAKGSLSTLSVEAAAAICPTLLNEYHVILGYITTLLVTCDVVSIPHLRKILG